MKRWRLLAPVIVLMAVLATASDARNGHQTGRTEAIRSALSALRVHSRTGAEIVFALRSPVPAGTVVRDGGPTDPGPTGRTVRSSTRVVARARGRAWLFYEDLAPFQQYAHSGRVVLVDASSGRVTVSGRLSWPPTLDGRLPVFLGSQTAYLGSRYRVFYRPYAGAKKLAKRASARMTAPGVRLVPRALDRTGGAQVAGLLASEHACVVRFSDTVPGGYYAFAHISQSRAALAFRFSQLSDFAGGFQSFIYSRASGVSPTAFISSLISAHGCKDVMLYMAGGGYAGAGAANIGMGINVADPSHQDVSAAELRGLAGANRGVDFELVLDAPHTAAFQSLQAINNVLLVASPVAPGGGSFTYLPDARVGGRLVTNDTNPMHILQLTDRLAYGLDRVIDTPAEVAQLAALNKAGKLPSVLAYIVARGFALGGPVDFVANTGVGGPPRVRFHGFSAGPPSGGGNGGSQGGSGGNQGGNGGGNQGGNGGGNQGGNGGGTPVVSAHGDSYQATNNAVVSENAAAGVLANDTDSANHPLSVDQLNGTGGTAPFTATTAKGAMVTLQSDGSFSYDPTGSAILQAIVRGQTTTDTFTYRANDGHGGTATATVTITVTGAVNHLPVANPDSYSVDNNATLSKDAAAGVLGNDTDADSDSLKVDQLNGAGGTLPLSGTSVKGAAVTISGDGSFTYDPTGSPALEAIGRGQTTTDTFTYRANDGQGGTATATVTITVTGAVNHPPAATDDSYVTNNNAALSKDAAGGVLANDTDLDGDALAVDQLNGAGGNPLVGASTDGALVTLQSDGSFTYNPVTSPALQNIKLGQTTTDTFTYRVADGQGGFSTATVSITVTGAVDHPPVANSDSAVTTENTAVDINVLGNDSDPDGDALHIASVDTTTLGTKGSVSINADNTLHYDPNGQFTSLGEGQIAIDKFIYMAADPSGETSPPVEVDVTIVGVNDPPALANIESSPLAYSTGDPGVAISSTLTVSDVDSPTLAGATVSITSGLGASDSLFFVDQNGITGVYDPGSGVLTLSGTASVADYQAALRSVAFLAGDPTPSGSRTVSFQVDDGASLNHLSNTVSREIDVTHVNHPPVAVDDNATTNEKTATDINVLGNDADPDGDSPLHLVSVDTTGTKGSVSINPDGTIHYDPSGQFDSLGEGQTAQDSFTYIAADPSSANSNSATVHLTITGVNDPPTLASTETTPLAVFSGPPATPITASVTATDIDSPTLAGASVTITSGLDTVDHDTLGFVSQNGISGAYDGATGTLTLSGSSSVANYQAALRSVTFQTDPAAPTANRTVSFQVDDGASQNHLSNTVSREIDVTHFNAPPVANTDTYGSVASPATVGNTKLQIGPTDTASGPHFFSSAGGVLANDTDDQTPNSGLTATPGTITSSNGGTVTLNADGTFTYLPAQGFTGMDSFSYTVHDHDSGGDKTATGTANVWVGGPTVWYVDDSQGAAGDGRSDTPFNALSPLTTGGSANSKVANGDIIFLYQGSSSYTGGIVLKPNMQLLGQPHGLTVLGRTLVPAGGANPTITNAAGDGIDLANGSDVERVDVGTSSGVGINGTGVTTSTVGANTAISGATGGAFALTGAASGDISIGSNITNTSGHSVSIAGRTGGTVTLNGPVSDTGTGISLTGNTGATIHFSGTINASTGASTAFNATGGGTITAAGSASTLATTSATALNVANTTIGSSGLTFRSISAGTSSTGPARGISLVSTGSSGGLVVTGSGTTGGSGGTIQHTTSSGTETFGSGDGGIYLSNTADVSLTEMNVNSNHASGIYGTGVTNLTLAGDSISANGTSNTNNDDGLRIDGLTGTGTIGTTTISGSAESDGRIVSGTSGSLTMNVTGSTFSTAAKGFGLLVSPNGASVNTTATNDTFSQNFSDGLSVLTTASGTGTITFSAKNNTVTNNTGAGIVLGAGSTPGVNPPATFTISSNTVTGQQGSGINVLNGAGGTWTGHVTQNTVGDPNTANSGSKAGWGVIVKQEGSGTLTADVSNNTIRQIENFNGVEGSADTGAGTLNLTMTGNDIDNNQATSQDGIFINAGVLSADTSTVCLNATGNTSKSEGTASPPPAGNGLFDAAGLAVDNNNAGTSFKIVGLPAGDDGAVATYLASNNTLTGPGGPAFAQHNASGSGFTTAASCPTAP